MYGYESTGSLHLDTPLSTGKFNFNFDASGESIEDLLKECGIEGIYNKSGVREIRIKEQTEAFGPLEIVLSVADTDENSGGARIDCDLHFKDAETGDSFWENLDASEEFLRDPEVHEDVKVALKKLVEAVNNFFKENTTWLPVEKSFIYEKYRRTVYVEAVLFSSKELRRERDNVTFELAPYQLIFDESKLDEYADDLLLGEFDH